MNILTITTTAEGGEVEASVRLEAPAKPSKEEYMQLLLGSLMTIQQEINAIRDGNFNPK